MIKLLKPFLIAIAAGLIAACGSFHQTIGKASTASVMQDEGTFTNPLFPNGADPWLEYWDGNYYLTTTTWTSELVMRKSPTLAGLADARPVNVWSSADPDRCCNFWAFEFHRLKGPRGYRWYMMYTAGQDGTLDHQHLNVLESAGDDPMGPYQYKGAPMPNVWNIDGNYLQYKDRLFLIYSQWQGDEQRNLIAELENPWTLKADTPHTVITRPELVWEISGRKVTEGAEILQHKGRTFMTYSASFCNTPDYKLGLLELVGDDPLNATHWKKYSDPVLVRSDTVFGPGHNGFFKSPDGKEDWLVYHGNDSIEHGCGATRSLRAQRFTWNDDGTPNFGEPLTPGIIVNPPSGEYGPLVSRVQGQAYQLVNATSGLCLDISSNPQDNNAVQRECSASNGKWVLDALSDEYFRLANGEDSKFLEVAECRVGDNARIQSSAWRNKYCQHWKIVTSQLGEVQLVNRYSGKPLGIVGCSSQVNQAVVQSDEQSACTNWQLRPEGVMALVSEQSGKVLSVANCSVKTGANAVQMGFDYLDCQQWQMQASDAGFVRVTPKQSNQLCLAAAQSNASSNVVPGTNIQLSSCDDKTAQWQLKPVIGGGVTLVNRYTRQVMGLENCGLAENTNIAQQPELGNRCQVFHLKKL